MYRTHTCGELTKKNVGKTVTLSGWVDSARTHGKIGFINIRDRYGITQLVLGRNLVKKIGDLRKESVIMAGGKVKARPAKLANKRLKTGEIEVEVSTLDILNKAEPLPLELGEGVESFEETRLKYRYLDLRRERMQNNMLLRHRAINFIREYLDNKGFIEVTTPILTKSTPEGARDYLVPSRLHKGKFYALPQSPQQYKQLLMIAGFDRYFQIAPCFRDEDARADRCPGEFYQLDLEMSFVEQKDILDLIEALYIQLVRKVFPKKKIAKIPFPRLSYNDVIKRYGTDKPDLRKDKNNKDELAFCWILDFPLFEEELENGRYAPKHHMFTMPKESDMRYLKTNPHKVRSYQHDLVLNGLEIGGGSIRIHDPALQEVIFDLIGFTDEQKKYFSHMLEAFKYGAPPHGGIAPGIDRSLMAITGETIRDMIAFPKNKEAQDVTMDAPSWVSKEQLDELGIMVKK